MFLFADTDQVYITKSVSMTKYIRSLHKLRSLVQDIFAESAISVDTKAIVLVLAGSMHSTDFISWIDRISALDAINIKLKEINNLRAELGPVCEDYLLLKVLHTLEADVSSDELQQFISCSDASQEIMPLTAALLADDIRKALHIMPDQTKTDQITPEHQHLNAMIQIAIQELQQRLANFDESHLSSVVDTYTSCRQHASPGIAYAAVVSAIRAILTANGLATPAATECSNKIVTHALDQFIKSTDQENVILSFSKNLS